MRQDSLILCEQESACHAPATAASSITADKEGARPISTASENHQASVADEPLRFREKLGYGLGDTASNFFFQVFNILLLYYYTDIFGLSAAAVGTMFLVTKVVDAASDPIMGLIADRTSSRWGKFRPYLLWAAVPYGICGYAMFAGPDLSYTGKLIYAYATYTLMMLAYTAINVPYSALMGVISSSSVERTKVASYRFFCAFTAAWLIGTFVTPLKNILGGDNEALGFQLTMAIFAVVSVALFWICFATTRERVQPVQKDTYVRRDLKAVLSNGPWLALFLTAVFTLMNVAVRNGSILYYFKYYVGDDGARIFMIFDRTAVFMSLGLLAMVIGTTLTKTLCDYFEKQRLLIVLTILNAITMAAFYFIPPDQYWLMVLINCVGTLLIGPTPPLVWSMYTDTADYGEWKSGRRTTGLIFSSLQFAQKLGLAFGAGMAGVLLAWFGFVANEVQTDEAMAGIRFLFSILPAILALAGAVAILFYKIDSKTIKTVERDLQERHATS